MNKNKMAPPIRFQGFTGDWEQCKIADVAEIITGGTPSTRIVEYWNPPEVPWLSSGEVHKKYITSTDTMISRKGYENSSATMVRENSVLIALAGQGKTRGTVAINRIPLATNQSIAAMTFSDDIDPDYVFSNLENRYEELRRISSGDGSRGGLNKKLVGDVTIPCPTLLEQNAIGTLFRVLNELITLHQRKLEQQKKLKAFFLKNMFPEEGETVPRIRFKGFTGDWEQRKLGEIGTTFSGLSGKAKEDFGHGEAQFVTYMNVYLNAVSDSSMTERVEIDDHQNKVQYGDVFFTTSSETPDEVGMASVWFGSKDNTYLNSFCFGFRPTKEIDPYYMAFMLRSDIIRRKIIILAQGISRYNLSKKQVMKIVVPLPELSEQYKIGAYLQSLDHLITLHQRKLDQLQVMKKFMLQNLFV